MRNLLWLKLSERKFSVEVCQKINWFSLLNLADSVGLRGYFGDPGESVPFLLCLLQRKTMF